MSYLQLTNMFGTQLTMYRVTEFYEEKEDSIPAKQVMDRAGAISESDVYQDIPLIYHIEARLTTAERATLYTMDGQKSRIRFDDHAGILAWVWMESIDIRHAIIEDHSRPWMTTIELVVIPDVVMVEYILNRDFEHGNFDHYVITGDGGTENMENGGFEHGDFSHYTVIDDGGSSSNIIVDRTVNAQDNSGAWNQIGADPFLDSNDGDTSYETSAVVSQISDIFDFANLPVGASTINSVWLHIYIRKTGGFFWNNYRIKVELNDGGGWYTDGWIEGANTAYQDISIDITANFNTVAKVNAMQMRFTLEMEGGFASEVRVTYSYIHVDYNEIIAGNPPLVDTTNPHSGTYHFSCYTDGADYHDFQISQTFTNPIPVNDMTSFSFWWRLGVASQDWWQVDYSDATDTGHIVIANAAVYTQENVLAHLTAGKTAIRIRFGRTADNATNLRLDDISVVVTRYPQVFTYEPYTGTYHMGAYDDGDDYHMFQFYQNFATVPVNIISSFTFWYKGGSPVIDWYQVDYSDATNTGHIAIATTTVYTQENVLAHLTAGKGVVRITFGRDSNSAPQIYIDNISLMAP